MSYYSVKVICTVKGRKSAHGASKGAKAEFVANQEAGTPEEAVKLLAQVFTAEDGYRVEACPAS
jgi:hypothetical protein